MILERNNTSESSGVASSAAKIIKKSRVLNTFDKILKRARNLYKTCWLQRDIEAKRQSLVKAINEGCTLDYTADVFKREYAKRVSTLMDSNYFCKKCEDISKKPYDVATHLVMMSGVKGITSLLVDRNYDGENTVFTPYPEWSEPLFTTEDLKDYLPSTIISNL